MPTASPIERSDSNLKLSRSVVFPLVGGRSTWSQEHLLPIFATIVVALVLFVVLINADAVGKDISRAWTVYISLGIYIVFVMNYYIAQLCRRAKPLWVLGGVTYFTFALLMTRFWDSWANIFYEVVPGRHWERSPVPVVKLAGYVFGTGFCEEGLKALPLLVLALLGAGLAWAGRHINGPSSRLLRGINRRLGLREPLDGIVLGVASGSGFFLDETLRQYVPNMMGTVKYAGSQAFDGLLDLLARGIPQLVEHSAWAGLFGYFIGLSVLRPTMAFFLLPLGWFSAAGLHGLWDASGEILGSGPIVLFAYLFLGLLNYGLLGGAIFKAREISPTHAFAPTQGASPEIAISPPVPAPAPAPASSTGA